MIAETKENRSHALETGVFEDKIKGIIDIKNINELDKGGPVL